MAARAQPGGGAGGEGLAVAVGRRVGDDEGDEHVSRSPGAPVQAWRRARLRSRTQRQQLVDGNEQQQQREHDVRRLLAQPVGDRCADHGRECTEPTDDRRRADVDVGVLAVAERAHDRRRHDDSDRRSLGDDGRHAERRHRRHHDHAAADAEQPCERPRHEPDQHEDDRPPRP